MENDCIDETEMPDLTVACLYHDLTDLRGRMWDMEVGNQRLCSDLKECFGQFRSDMVNLEKAVTSTRGMYITDKEQHAALVEQVRHLKAKTDFLRSPNKAAMELAFSAPQLKPAPAPSTPTEQKVRSRLAPPSTDSVVMLSDAQAQLERERYTAAMASAPAPGPVVHHHHQHVQNTNGNVFLAGSFSTTTLTNSLMEQPAAPAVEPTEDSSSATRLLTGKATKQGDDGKIYLHHFIRLNRENGNLLFQGGLPFHDEHRPIHPSCMKNKSAQRYACEMIELVITPQERTELGKPPGPKHPTKEDMAFYDSITRRVMDRLLEFEDKDPEVERQTKTKRPGRDCTSTVLAIGKRVKKYKNIVKAARPDLMETSKKVSRSFDPTPLIPGCREGGLPVGTPKGNRSILKMFAKPDNGDEPPRKKTKF